MKSNLKGYTLLEFVITLPITMLFLFGITDVMRVLSTQTAIDSGTQSALRCLSPVNGDCSTNISSSYTKFYDVFKLRQYNKYLTDSYSFQATANTISSNQYESNIQANILKQGYLQLKPYKTTFTELSYPASIQSNYYVMTKSLPQILGNAISLEEQRFVLKNNHKYNYAPKIKKTNKFTLTIPKNDNASSNYKEISFTIPANDDCKVNLPCFVADNLDKSTDSTSSTNTNFQNNCNEIFPWRNHDTFGVKNEIKYKEIFNSGIVCTTTPILLFIKGSADIAQNDKAKVDIELLDQNNNLVRSLGGRAFDKNSSATFVARGAPIENYSSELQNKFKNAELKYHQAIQIDFNKQYKIRFKLQRTNNSHDNVVNWTFNEIDIFTPEYMLKELEAKCENPILLSESSKNNLLKCNPIGISTSIFNKLDYSFNILSFNGTPSNKKIISKCSLDKSRLNDLLIANKIDTKLANSFIETQPIACDNFETVTYSCPDNLGSKNSNEYKNICPYNIENLNYTWKDLFSPIQLDKFDFETINLGNITWHKAICTDDVVKYLKNDWNKYKDITIKSTKIGEIPINLSNDKFCDKINFDNYNCNDFNFSKENIKPQTNSQFQTLLFGKHIGKLCKWNDEKWKDILYEQIMTNWDDFKNSCFEMDMQYSGKKILDNIPSDECVEYSLESNQSQEDKIKLGNFPESQIPDDCKNTTNVCEFIFTGFKKNDDSTISQNKEKDLKQAESVAFDNIKKLLPNVTKNCNESYCLTFSSMETTNDVQFTSKIKIPIYTLLGKKIEIQSSSFRKKEKL